MPISVNVREAKKQMAELLNRVQSGETVIIRRNSIPAARIVELTTDHPSGEMVTSVIMKTHLSDIIQRAAQSGPVIVTRKSVPVATLEALVVEPVAPPPPPPQPREESPVILPDQADFYRIIIGKMTSYARRWRADMEEMTASFVTVYTGRSKTAPTTYVVHGPGGLLQYFKDDREAPMPQDRGRQKVVQDGPHSAANIMARMAACADYVAPRGMAKTG